MKSPDHVLELLFDRGEKYFPLDELAKAAGLTPRRLDAALDLLRERGHQLELSPAQGLRLVWPVNLDAHLIERGLGTRRVGRHVICFNEVGSTNDIAFDSARQDKADGLVVLAQSQRKGRGRQGRAWHSRPGENILMSILLQDPRGQLAHEALTVAAGLAVAEGIEAACGLACQLKWPNDVLLDEAKLAGVLVEIKKVAARPWVVVGIGVNVHSYPPRDQVDAPATCVAEHTGGEADRLAIVREVLVRLDEWVGELPRNIEALRTQWLRRCEMINQRVTVACAGKQHTGRVLDVSPLEGLFLACDDGRRIHLPAAGSSIVK